ncbi:hypothetical protein EK21DRAFT_109850 [Setomelanomma holmii]|uniref:Uncharacterized protein n=1 Tax=Setomelanomma holmii TaxID=210430 RepID=A0A9P4HD25_9PLEO|nr:hypothetical protein EK21DRAFT_109850 [Setomelanomma holmii]
MRRKQSLLPDDVRTLAAAIEEQDEQWNSLANLMALGDDHFYWREGAYQNLLERVKPHLHPWLSTHASEFNEGAASLAAGGMKIRIHTQCTAKDLLELCDAEHDQAWGGEYLTQSPVQSARLCCLKGAEWDRTNKSVIDRDGFTWRYSSILAQRERGVRMGDLVNELRGVLVPESDLDAMVLLEWHFTDHTGTR